MGKNKLEKKIEADISEMITGILEYLEGNELPIFVELCALRGWDKDKVLGLCREHGDLDLAVKRLLYKKDSFIERCFFEGKLDKNVLPFVAKMYDFMQINSLNGAEVSCAEVLEESTLERIIKAVGEVDCCDRIGE